MSTRRVLLWLSLLLLSAQCIPADTVAPDAIAEARRELFAAHYQNAVELYSRITVEQPHNADAWYGLVRAQLGLHDSKEAYASAEQALANAPDTAGALTAAGFAAYRRGDITAAEHFYQNALKIDPNYQGALSGFATLCSSVSLFRTARNLRLQAYKAWPDDPALMAAYASTLKRSERISALVAALARLDPASEQARKLAARIADDRVIGDRKLARLTTPYQSTQIKLFRIFEGPRLTRGVGVAIRLNGKYTAHLLLDTGASGVSISPKLAEKAGLKAISGERFETKGIGDGKAQSSIAYIAAELRAGDVTFADFPVSAFDSARSADYDGLIGADVFSRFIVKIDFVDLVLSLEARPNAPAEDSDEPVDFKGPLAPGFYRVFRFGDHLAVPTFINGANRPTLFLVDSGSTNNLIDTDTARASTKVSNDSFAVVKGIQGKVDETSRANRVSLVFAGFRQDNPDLLAISLEKMSDSVGVGFGGILGMPVLGRLAVTIDYSAGAIRFEYRAR